MQFSEKLDFLMQVSNVTNSSLAQYTSLDASHISRLRRGERNLSKHESYVRLMAAYFAKHCDREYQQRALAEAMEQDPSVPFEETERAELIYTWLREETSPQHATVAHFLNRMTKHSPEKRPAVQEQPKDGERALPEPGISVFYGREGKQQAVLRFLSAVVAAREPRTLLLYSDEDMDWMTSSPAFTAQWASLMFQTIARGNRITIIHNISRNLDEMLEAITQWMPLYMSGAIDPYFYPKKRDGIFKRTLFIAPEVAAVVSSSVGAMEREAANVLYTDSRAVYAYSIEYRQYLSLCKPLMQIYNQKDQEGYLSTLMEFEREQADAVIKTESISSLTMPMDLVSEIGDRLNIKNEKFLGYHGKRMELFLEHLQTNDFTEIICLPPVAAVKGGHVKLAFSEMLIGGAAYYTLEEYGRHLRQLVRLLEEQERFRISLVAVSTEDRYMVYAKEDLGAIVAKTSAPQVVLAMNESNMTAAFWDFLMSMIKTRVDSGQEKSETIAKLRAYIRLLEPEGADSGNA